MISQNIHTDEWHWRRAIPAEPIHSKEIHVWRVFLDSPSLQIENLQEMLSADEIERARRFHFEKDQKHFITARAILRQILGGYLGKDPHTLCFEYTSFGKPTLATDGDFNAIQFNLSHSGALAIYAVTHRRKIGIDIERIRDEVAVEQIAKRFFSNGEMRSLERMDQSERAGAFFQYWTRKEAFLKAMGEGVSFPMEKCDVSLMGGKIMSPVTVLDDNVQSPLWYGQDLFPGPGYAAAIAVEGNDWELSYWDYDHEMHRSHKS